jgi:hypothetical protein
VIRGIAFLDKTCLAAPIVTKPGALSPLPIPALRRLMHDRIFDGPAPHRQQAAQPRACRQGRRDIGSGRTGRQADSREEGEARYRLTQRAIIGEKALPCRRDQTAGSRSRYSAASGVSNRPGTEAHCIEPRAELTRPGTKIRVVVNPEIR